MQGRITRWGPYRWKGLDREWDHLPWVRCSFCGLMVKLPRRCHGEAYCSEHCKERGTRKRRVSMRALKEIK